MTGAFLVCLIAIVLGALLGNLHAPQKLRLRQFGRVRGDFFWERVAAVGIPVVPLPAAGPIYGRPRKEGIYDAGPFLRGRGTAASPAIWDTEPDFHHLPLFQNFQNFNSFPGLFAHVARDSVNLRPLGRMRPYRQAPYTFAQLERMKTSKENYRGA